MFSDTDAVKELVRQHWNRRAANFDEEASHGLLNDLQARAWRRLIARIAGPASLDALERCCTKLARLNCVADVNPPRYKSAARSPELLA